QTYDRDGFPIKRVDLTGRPHGVVPTPHMVEFERHVNPDTGEVFVKPERTVRPAKPEEIP
ncbi:MAG: polymorphic toxin type 24 domain-containing protein, partial [Gammaproteobacteria bacterium]